MLIKRTIVWSAGEIGSILLFVIVLMDSMMMGYQKIVYNVISLAVNVISKDVSNVRRTEQDLFTDNVFVQQMKKAFHD